MPFVPEESEDNVPTLEIRTKHQEEEMALGDDDLLLASPIVYGFSLSDKIWCGYPSFFRVVSITQSSI